MPLEDLPNGFAAPPRAEVATRCRRDYALRQPGAPTGPGSQAAIDAAVIADTLMPVYANGVSTARGANLDDATLAQLNAECRAIGIPEQLPAGTGTGFVKITASVAGVYISSVQELRDEQRNLRFRAATSGTYYDGKPVPVVGIDVGPLTNIPAGTRLKWKTPPPGLGGIATVEADTRGNGFSGGREAEVESDIVRRIKATRAEPPSGGNVAQVRTLVYDAGRDLGIPIQEVFVYSAIVGSGHYAYVFTLRPGAPGTSRVPTEIQRAQVRAYIAKALPEDDGILDCALIDQDVDLVFAIEWATDGWVDSNTWPKWGDDFEVSAVTDANHFRVYSPATAPTAPQIGKTIAFYNSNAGAFVRKRIVGVAAVSSSLWDLVIDQTNDASDTTYMPVVGNRFCPWSPSLDLVVSPMFERMNLLGPSEQIETDAFFDDGLRQRRVPLDPTDFPYEMRNKTTELVEALAQVQDFKVLSPALPVTPDVGEPGASSNLLFLLSILVFPL